MSCFTNKRTRDVRFFENDMLDGRRQGGYEKNRSPKAKYFHGNSVFAVHMESSSRLRSSSISASNSFSRRSCVSSSRFSRSYSS